MEYSLKSLNSNQKTSTKLQIAVMGYRKRFINLLQAVARHFDEKWVLLYVERWMKAPMEEADGRQETKLLLREGVMSPLLSNLFLHYVLDAWLEKHHASLKFEPYADDVEVH